MKLSGELIEATTKWIDDEMAAEHIALLEHFVVKLSGTVGEGRNSGSFTGTGVIARVDSAATYVLTAKHNLHVACKDSGGGQNGYVDYFKRKVKVIFTKHDDSTLQGAISDITFPDGAIDDFGYDVAILKIGNVGALAFANAVRTLVSPARSLYTSMYTSFAWQHDTGGLWERKEVDARPPLLEFFSAADAALVLANGRRYREVVDERKNFVLLQFGYGKVTTGGIYGFARRALKIAALGNPAWLDRTHEGYRDVFVFDTDDANTALQGDSGGPVFALDPAGARAWLIGLHLGANYYTNKTDDDGETENNAFTVVTSEHLGNFIVTP